VLGVFQQPISTTSLAAGVILTMAVIPMNNMQARDTEAKCEEIVRNVGLRLELDTHAKPGRVYVTFTNRTSNPLWFPKLQEPSFKRDDSRRQLTIWLGYFDEVYGEFRGRYMLPPMQQVPPGQDLRLELTSIAIVQLLIDYQYSPLVLARIAREALPQTRVRGEQPLDQYIHSSCIVQSSGNPENPQ
jgi:hypothetical protein